MLPTALKKQLMRCYKSLILIQHEVQNTESSGYMKITSLCSFVACNEALQVCFQYQNDSYCVCTKLNGSIKGEDEAEDKGVRDT